MKPADLGSRMKALRQARRPRLSQAAVAARLGTTRQTVDRWENAVYAPPLDSLVAYLALMDHEIDLEFLPTSDDRAATSDQLELLAAAREAYRDLPDAVAANFARLLRETVKSLKPS